MPELMEGGENYSDWENIDTAGVVVLARVCLAAEQSEGDTGSHEIGGCDSETLKQRCLT